MHDNFLGVFKKIPAVIPMIELILCKFSNSNEGYVC